MKLITLSCPKCSAQLQINEQLNHAICNYCGYHFLVDDEARNVNLKIKNSKQVGRDLEIGRRSVRGGNQELAQEVIELIQPLSDLCDSTILMNSLPKQIKKHSDAAQVSKIIAIVFFSLGVFYGLYEGITNGDFIISFVAGIFTGAFFGGIPFFIWLKNISDKEGKEKQLNSATKKNINALEALKGKDVDVIPPAYRSKQAMTFIYNACIIRCGLKF